MAGVSSLSQKRGFVLGSASANWRKEKDGVLSPSYRVSSHVPSCEAGCGTFVLFDHWWGRSLETVSGRKGIGVAIRFRP